MSAVVTWTASLAPDPPYAVVPLFSTLGGLAVALVAWRRHGGGTNWPLAWVLGNLFGSAVGAIVLLVLTFLEVT